MKTRLAPAICVALIFLAGCSRSDEPSRGRHSGTASPGTASLSLPARWWLWTESIAVAENPIDDPDGSSCAKNQPHDVWFLAGTHGGSAVRDCRLPSGASVYFPVINQICVLPGETEATALRACSGAADFASATLDGRNLKIKEADSGGFFDFDAQPDSSSGMQPGRNRAVAWGLWIGPTPLSDGKHVVRFKASSGTFSLDVTYRLQVG